MVGNGPTSDKRMDLNDMAAKARAMIGELRSLGVPEGAIGIIEKLITQGRVGDAYSRVALLKTIVEEGRPDALIKRVDYISGMGEQAISCILEISRSLFDIDVWEQYRSVGYGDFDSFCAGTFQLRSNAGRAVERLQSEFFYRPGELFAHTALVELLKVAGAISSPQRKED